MSGSKKTRPIDNSHCFRGLGLPYWRDMARGLQPVFASGRDGHYIDYQTDKKDGFAIQPWWVGGATDLDTLVLLCLRHHALLEPARGDPRD